MSCCIFILWRKKKITCWVFLVVDNLQADSSQTQWILNEGHKIDSLPLDWFSAIIYFTRVIGINNLRDDVWCDADFPGSGRIIWLWIRWITFPDPLDTLWRATDMYICITGWVGCVMVGGYTLGRPVPVYQVYSGTTLRCAVLCNVLM